MSDLVISSYQNELWHLVHDAIHQMLASINDTIRVMEENTDSRVVMMECCRQLQADLLKLEDDAAAETFLIEKLLETAQRSWNSGTLHWRPTKVWLHYQTFQWIR